ncbi:MAG: C40 family peptidase [Flavobacteriales bacterium]|nr:C40 family peptidase [Flavobacteriales bacterium]
MDEFYCDLACVPIRREAASSSEIVSQLLYGEPYTILDDQGEWIRIKSSRDNYTGFISSSQHEGIGDAQCYRFTVTDRFIERGGLIFSMGSKVEREQPEAEPELFAQAMKFLDAPYLWGGKTCMGIDCSALVQVSLFAMGIDFPRDSGDQFAVAGMDVGFAELRRNDLVFFRGVSGRIVHVGIASGDGHILHASGRVRLDRLDEQGIKREDSRGGIYTHKKPLIRRYNW